MKIKPIRSDRDYQLALERVEKLWGSAANTPQGDELEVLVTLIEAYERQNYPIDLPDPLDAIRFRLEQSGKNLLTLVGIVGQRTRVYEVMRGARPLSLTMIRNLHRELGIPAEVLIRPSQRASHKRLYGRSAAVKRSRLRKSA
jgi:HTH-type transcriptional regulator / antitoxin HigA